MPSEFATAHREPAAEMALGLASGVLYLSNVSKFGDNSGKEAVFVGDAVNKQRGFSLIELLVVVAIVLITSAIAIPSLIRSRIAANEASAVASLRTISTAESTYASSWGAGYAATLDNLGGPPPCNVAKAAAACIVDPQLSVAPHAKSGYVFVAIGNTQVAGINEGFELNATPSVVDVTGERAFCGDQTGVLRSNFTGAKIGTNPGDCSKVLTLIVGN
jgi:prepilin-type N-terminal cleavage/methylation domain-containing protein